MRGCLFAVSLALAGTAAAAQDTHKRWELSAYGGWQGSVPGRVVGTGGAVDGLDTVIAWEGRSFEISPYYGGRATYWMSPEWGVSLEFNHAKAIAPQAQRDALGFKNFEFTHGLNFATVNAHRAFPGTMGRIDPYVLVGLGVTIPHVDVSRGTMKTAEYQFGGLAASVGAGLRYRLTDSMSAYTEYKTTVTTLNPLLADGGRLKTTIVANAINVGISYSF